jgi:hypothetical protein
MATCINYNCDEFSDYTQSDCVDALLGGIPSAVLLHCGHTVTDPSQAAQITTAITNGSKKLNGVLKLTISAPSAVTVAAVVACQTEKLLTYNREVVWFDANVNEDNVTFYNELFDGRPLGGLIAYLCDSDQVLFIDEPISFQGGLIVPENNDDYIRFEGTGAYRSKYSPTLHAAPVGIFS